MSMRASINGGCRELSTPLRKIYFAPGSQFYGETKAGGYTCKAFAEKAGFRASKGN